MPGFSSAKANTEFELKFTAPASLLLGVAEPIANKTAVYVQLGANLAAARRAIENLSGEDAHNPGPKRPPTRCAGPNVHRGRVPRFKIDENRVPYLKIAQK